MKEKKNENSGNPRGSMMQGKQIPQMRSGPGGLFTKTRKDSNKAAMTASCKKQAKSRTAVTYNLK